MRLFVVFSLLLLALQAAGARAAGVEEITALVSGGHWQQAGREIEHELSGSGMSFQTREALLFQKDRMMRMRLDFDKTRAQVFQEARAMAPGINEEMFGRWEKAGSVEFLEVDGTRWYFDHAADNLFRVNAEAWALRLKDHPGSVPREPAYRLEDVRNVIANYDRTGERFNSPKSWRVTYVLSVKPGAVPPGEILRAWLPFPHAGNRQKDIRLISADPARCILSDTNGAIASVYMEKPAVDGQPTQFKIVFEYTADAFYQTVDPARVVPVSTNDPALAPFLGEHPPQIVFSDEIKQLSRDIVGQETNPCLKARRIFQWAVRNITWASAREYSTIESLPHYALSCHHGDCGIETMTFMTLCRLNGIPARWESGWMTGVEKDMHDWCEIYIAPYGWMPADVYYGLVNSDQDREKWFYLGGIDASRLVVNTGYGQPLYPAKTFFRSEIVDFQRGEVEWRGGNLYFNQWNLEFQRGRNPANQ